MQHRVWNGDRTCFARNAGHPNGTARRDLLDVHYGKSFVRLVSRGTRAQIGNRSSFLTHGPPQDLAVFFILHFALFTLHFALTASGGARRRLTRGVSVANDQARGAKQTRQSDSDSERACHEWADGTRSVPTTSGKPRQSDWGRRKGLLHFSLTASGGTRRRLLAGLSVANGRAARPITIVCHRQREWSGEGFTRSTHALIGLAIVDSEVAFRRRRYTTRDIQRCRYLWRMETGIPRIGREHGSVPRTIRLQSLCGGHRLR